MLLHYLYRPDPQVKAETFEPSMTLAEADKAMIDVCLLSRPSEPLLIVYPHQSLQIGITNSTLLELDHHIAYLCHVELARLLVKLGDDRQAEARQHLNMVLEGKVPFGPTKGKGKVSMQNAFVMKANGIRKRRRQFANSNYC